MRTCFSEGCSRSCQTLLPQINRVGDHGNRAVAPQIEPDPPLFSGSGDVAEGNLSLFVGFAGLLNRNHLSILDPLRCESLLLQAPSMKLRRSCNLQLSQLRRCAQLSGFIACTGIVDEV